MIRRQAALFLIAMLLLPLAPLAGTFFCARRLSNWIDSWKWPEHILGVAERVKTWGGL